ncbi:MAG: Gfo/Idh/MocA family oxidoreductase [Lentisphaeria bacterium]|nr:Gfo/Idh/MocA family oxidoreductase [Lentisphaeria bacterium]
MKKYRVSFIAAGRMANSMAAQLKQLDQVELAGVYDPLPDRCAEFARKYAFARCCSSCAELLADQALDGVVICNYAPQHCETILAALAAGVKAIFCEKPAIRTLDEAQPLRTAVAQAGAKVMIGHHRKHIPASIRLKEMIDAGRLGKVYFAKVHYCNAGYSRDWDDYFASYQKSGGTTLDMATHFVDLLNWYFGEAESTSARAVMLERTLSKEVQPFDYVTATLTYRNGVICGLESSYQRYGVPLDTMEIYGDNYTAITDFRTLKLYNRNEIIDVNVGFPANDSDRQRQAKAFVSMMADGLPQQTTLEEGLAAARVGLAMLQSSERGGELIRF